MSKPSLIVVSGLPCCGKSTIAEGVSKAIGLPIFSVDHIESGILKAGIPRSFETGLAAYLVAESLASEHLKLGHSVIIDAVCSVDEAKQMWCDLALKHGAKLVIVECVCSDEDLHRQRVEDRVRNLHGFAEVTWDNIEARRREYTSWNEPILVLDAVNGSEENICKAVEYVEVCCEIT